MSGRFGIHRPSSSGMSLFNGIGKVNRRGGGIRRSASSSSIRTGSTRSIYKRTSRPRPGRGARSAKPRRRLLDGVNQETLAKVLTIGAFAVVGVVGLVLIFASANSGGKELETSVIENQASENVITTEDAGATLKLAFGGSVKLQQDIINAAAMGDSYDFNNYLSELGQVMSADVSIVNLMGTLDAAGDNSALAGYPQPNYPAQLGDALKNIGVTHAVTANSTALGKGFDGLTKTIDNLAGNDITALGSFRNPETGNNVYVKRVNSITIGIGAYNCLTDGAYNDLVNSQLAAGVTNEQLSYCVNQLVYTPNRSEGGKSYSLASDRILRDVQAMRGAGAQFVIICLNWGSASNTAPTDEMGTLAQRLIDAGVDVTVGYGSDVVQKVTVKDYKNADGTTKKCYVFYSLGNLLSDCDSGNTPEKQASMVVNMTLTRAAGEQALTVESATYHPIYINHDSQYDTQNTHLKYRSVPAYKYYYAEELPDVFSTAAQWKASKSAFDRIKGIAGSNLQAGTLAGDQSANTYSDDANVGGADSL